MKIPENITQIFAALLDAVAKGALSLMVGTDPATGEIRYYIGSIGIEDGSPIFARFGHLMPGRPLPTNLRLSRTTPNPTLH